MAEQIRARALIAVLFAVAALGTATSAEACQVRRSDYSQQDTDELNLRTSGFVALGALTDVQGEGGRLTLRVRPERTLRGPAEQALAAREVVFSTCDAARTSSPFTQVGVGDQVLVLGTGGADFTAIIDVIRADDPRAIHLLDLLNNGRQ
ncbi:hypothetical protein Q0812_07080 [Brevundimonas sp. 2R-24]|uniref:Uncharacterized protein n=1 Tax=Peiella sedimenti TaxID=3061083 RepID=A0ABT8SMJ1_9CAUL|nr:hypothetical protein [Caulobacteraceae bacterium XZ-24]